MNQDQIFDSLTRNAFDFLERGIKEFDQAPKYSVIHFSAAVEMLLKARLMKEHWSLIVSRPEQASLQKFMTGNFASASLEDCRARIRDISGENIDDAAFSSFRAMANHRNKMVHFFHDGLESDEKVKEQIVAEHCRSWFHLHRLLKQWGGYFHAYGKEIGRADRAMKQHRQYLKTKFKELDRDLKEIKNKGRKLGTCSVCKFKAAISDALDGKIASLRCLVCDYAETQVALECPKCGKYIDVGAVDIAACKHCGEVITPVVLRNSLMDDLKHIDIKCGADFRRVANCATCDGHETVVKRANGYFCTNCFEISSGVEQCQWCHEYNTGSMDNSFAFGCNFCGGRVGWDKGD